MPRQPRIDLPGIPQHVVQRGNDRQPCFFQEADYLRYLQELKELALRRHCAVHAYVLMTNHVHLLLTPSAAGQVAALMQSLGRRYVRYINDRHHRTGTLWEGRYKACPVDRESYLLHGYRYIELNPLRARMVDDPGGYRWSSYGANALGKHDPLVTPHPTFLALGPDAGSQPLAYRELVRQAISDDDLTAIRVHLQRQHALGTDRFRAAIDAQLGAAPARRRLVAPPSSGKVHSDSALAAGRAFNFGARGPVHASFLSRPLGCLARKRRIARAHEAPARSRAPTRRCPGWWPSAMGIPHAALAGRIPYPVRLRRSGRVGLVSPRYP